VREQVHDRERGVLGAASEMRADVGPDRVAVVVRPATFAEEPPRRPLPWCSCHLCHEPTVNEGWGGTIAMGEICLAMCHHELVPGQVTAPGAVGVASSAAYRHGVSAAGQLVAVTVPWVRPPAALRARSQRAQFVAVRGVRWTVQRDGRRGVTVVLMRCSGSRSCVYSSPPADRLSRSEPRADSDELSSPAASRIRTAGRWCSRPQASVSRQRPRATISAHRGPITSRCSHPRRRRGL
jgi:hypothetical protein